MCQQLVWLVKTGLPFYRLPVRPQNLVGSNRHWTGGRTFSKKTKRNTDNTIHVLDRSVNCHRKTSSSRSTAYDAHPVASQQHLEGTGNTRKGDSYPQVPAPPYTMVAGRRQCTHGPTITPNKTWAANFYRCIKRRVGRSLRRAHCKRNLVPSGKQAAYNLFGTKSSLSSLKRVPRSLLRQDTSCSNRQHHTGVKQGRRHEVVPTVCPTMEKLDLLYQEASDSQSLDTFQAG